MRIAICDDNWIQLQVLEDAARGCIHWRGERLTIDAFSSGDELLKSVNDGREYEYIFLDIEMPGKSGLDVYKELGFRPDTSIVFVSTHSELLPEAFELQPRGFLVKPYDQDTFNRAVKSVMAQRRETQYFRCTINGAEAAIPCAEIYYFEVKDHSLMVHSADTDGPKIVLNRLRLDTVEEQLTGCGFYRCNRSTLVNLRHCSIRAGTEVLMKPYCKTREIKLSESRVSDFDKALLTYKMGGS